jgi:hypothetical protein
MTLQRLVAALRRNPRLLAPSRRSLHKGAAASTSAASAADTKSGKPTVVLVHGALADTLGLRKLQDQRLSGAGIGQPAAQRGLRPRMRPAC